VKFWNPEFEIQRRNDGSILIKQTGAPLSYLPTLADYLDKWADETPDVPWLARRVDGGDWRKISYGEARQAAKTIGSALLAMGCSSQRPLLILSGNSLEHGLLGVACAYVGVPYAPISPAYSLVSTDHAKLKDIAKLLEPGAIYADDAAAFAPALKSIAFSDAKLIHLDAASDDAVGFESLLSTPANLAEEARNAIGPDTVLKYLFTSGSTGAPKAVINTNRMICANQAMVRDCYRFLVDQPPVVLDWAPWNHTAASNKVSYMVLTNGGTYYIDDGKPSPAGMVETLRNLKDIACTWYFNVPAGWDRLVEELETDDILAQTFFSRLQMMFYAGAGMAQRTWERLLAISKKTARRDILLATSLGATETAPFALAWTEQSPTSGNVGMPSRGIQMKLVPVGDKLEFRMKAPSVTPGYYRDPIKTAEAFDDEGYYMMGDALRPANPDDLTRGFFFDGRIAENFKLNTGTWVAVGSVRARLVDDFDGLIRDALIVGENQDKLGALLWLSESAESMDKISLASALDAKLKAHQAAATGSASRVMCTAILDHAPSFDRGELTEKGSLNQRALRANHTAKIEQMYK